MDTQTDTGRFAVSLSELEDGARVAYEDQRTESGEAPNDPPVSRYEFNVTRLLGVTAQGYW